MQIMCFNSQSTEVKLDVNKRQIISGDTRSDKQSTGGDIPDGRPSAEKLEIVYIKLSESLPKLFTHITDYTMYHPDMIFENNIRGTRTV